MSDMMHFLDIEKSKTGFATDIEKETLGNDYFRRVLYTTDKSQLTVMSLSPGEDAGEEVHEVDQFARVEQGSGKAVIGGKETKISDGSAFVVPAGTRHDIVNTSKDEDLKLYVIYSPPNHRPGMVHKTKADAMADEGGEA